MSIPGYDSWRLANPDDERGEDPYEDEDSGVDEPTALEELVDTLEQAQAALVRAREAAADPLQVLKLAEHDFDEAAAALFAARRKA